MYTVQTLGQIQCIQYYIIEIEKHGVIICTFASKVTGLDRFVKTGYSCCMCVL